MIYLFGSEHELIYYVSSETELSADDKKKLSWLFGKTVLDKYMPVMGKFIGPRKEMVTPWSTNAVEITQNMGINGIKRIEFFVPGSSGESFDPMTQQKYSELNSDTLTIDSDPEPIKYIDNISGYNDQEGLALSVDEIEYLDKLSVKLGRKLTDSEVFGFSQINSEHCRHKIFNGVFIIDGQEMPFSLFQLIKKTSKVNPNFIVSAYSDNVAFIRGPRISQFAPLKADKPGSYIIKEVDSVISLKAETHNFPTTVEPFNGAATGSGGEIRDRMAGGKGSFPLSGTAVYMTSYSRIKDGRMWEQYSEPRPWLYQNPVDILIKASNGASDFGNKFGQPLICGSLLTLEYFDSDKSFGYDKVIMLAGGVGYGLLNDSLKDIPDEGDIIVVMGGDNYRIGMGGGAVSSVSTGEFSNSLELNAVQRSNPEMQKRVYNVLRALSEMDKNPIVSIHDHGAGGHLNSLSELIEQKGGQIEIDKLPIGDPTLSYKEILSNESQERMGMVIKEKDSDLIRKIAQRERAPYYETGNVKSDSRILIVDSKNNSVPFELELADLFGKPPVSVLNGKTIKNKFDKSVFKFDDIYLYVKSLLQIESVACKDWLTNKVDRSVTGRVAMQQNAGILHLPLNNLAITALDYDGVKGIANSIGHAPLVALSDPEAGSRMSVAEALTNIVWAPLRAGLNGVSLSANWMWPAKTEDENARLYRAVDSISKFAIELGINIPTGKDSLSMTQKYPDGSSVAAPGTVIISAVAEVTNIDKSVTPVLQNSVMSDILYIDFSASEPSIDCSTFSMLFNSPGNNPPDIQDAGYFVKAFEAVQEMIDKRLILSGHDISAGGKITSLLEMTFSADGMGMEIELPDISREDIIKFLFSENAGLIIQTENASEVIAILDKRGVGFQKLGSSFHSDEISISTSHGILRFDIEEYRDIWFETSYLFELHQTTPALALKRYENYKKQPLNYQFPDVFSGLLTENGDRNINAAVIREKGINGDREMAYALYHAGFNVIDVHMTDLVEGRENLENINMLVFPGGFSNSDVLGSAKGWAGAFLYNEKAKKAIENYYKRTDTMSLGVCNGCQLMTELRLLHPESGKNPKMMHNDSAKFESAFVSVEILKSPSIMLESLEGSRLGVWIAHGEGKFLFASENESDCNIAMKYHYDQYPGNPNGSMFAAAGICSADGRHLAMMPHLERSVFPWQWPYYKTGRENDEVSPWVEAFVNARKWLEARSGF